MENENDVLADYIDCNVDILDTTSRKNNKQLRSLSTFFQTIKKEAVKFDKSFQKAIMTFKSSCNTEDTLCLTIVQWYEYL